MTHKHRRASECWAALLVAASVSLIKNVYRSKRGIHPLFFAVVVVVISNWSSSNSKAEGDRKYLRNTHLYLLYHLVFSHQHPRACRSTKSGSGTTIRRWWRCWRSSHPSRCPPPCCSPSCLCCSLATTLSAPLQTCTQERSTSPSPWSLTVPEVRTYNLVNAPFTKLSVCEHPSEDFCVGVKAGAVVFSAD